MIRHRVYISGRMSGLDRDVYTARFAVAEMSLRRLGYRVMNPCKIIAPWVVRIIGYRLTLLFDLLMMCRCDRIYMMPQWTKSRGARAERTFAESIGVREVTGEGKDDSDARVWAIINHQNQKQKRNGK